MDTAQLVFTLGDRLRKAREVAGITSTDMAAALGVHRNTVSNIEHDKVPVKRSMLLAWANLTGVDMDWIEGGGQLTRGSTAMDRVYREAA